MINLMTALLESLSFRSRAPEDPGRALRGPRAAAASSRKSRFLVGLLLSSFTQIYGGAGNGVGEKDKKDIKDNKDESGALV
jgi:hypothetical protein